MNKFNKHYFERYAELTLYSVFPEWNLHFFKSDRPDLQNELDDIGIEVTSSLPAQIWEVNAFGNKILGKRVSNEDKKSFAGELFLAPEGVAYAFSPTRGLMDINKCNQILDAISHKRNKWKKYKSFRIRGLYVFTGTSAIDNDILTKIEGSEAFSFFQLIFINAIDTIYYYKNGWKKKAFTNEELSLFKNTALES